MLQRGFEGMSVHKTRGFLYWLARLLGDYQAVSSGSPEKMPGVSAGEQPAGQREGGCGSCLSS